MTEWEWAVEYTYDNGIVPAFTEILVMNSEENAWRSRNWTSKQPNVTISKVIKRPVGNWENADA